MVIISEFSIKVAGNVNSVFCIAIQNGKRKNLGFSLLRTKHTRKRSIFVILGSISLVLWKIHILLGIFLYFLLKDVAKLRHTTIQIRGLRNYRQPEQQKWTVSPEVLTHHFLYSSSISPFKYVVKYVSIAVTGPYALVTDMQGSELS